MVKVICQHSGIEFEASSKRTKNHPLVSEMKADANKRGNYREVMTAMDAVKAAGGYTTAEEFIQAVKNHLQGIKDAAKARAEKARNYEADRKAKNEAFEAWLPANDYTVVIENYTEWVDNPNPRDFMDEMIPVERKRTVITAPDNQQIERHEAYRIFDGKITLEETRKAQRDASAREAQRQVEIWSRQVAKENSLREFDCLADEIRSSNTQVQQIEGSREAETIANVTGTGYRGRDEIRKWQVNGNDCYLIITGTGYDDDGYWSYWTTDPSAIDAKTVEDEESDDTAARICSSPPSKYPSEWSTSRG